VIEASIASLPGLSSGPEASTRQLEAKLRLQNAVGCLLQSIRHAALFDALTAAFDWKSIAMKVKLSTGDTGNSPRQAGSF
jgi:hypothetical protein